MREIRRKRNRSTRRFREEAGSVQIGAFEISYSDPPTQEELRNMAVASAHSQLMQQMDVLGIVSYEGLEFLEDATDGVVGPMDVIESAGNEVDRSLLRFLKNQIE